MKNTKRIVSFLLSAIMVVTTFLAVGPVFTIEAEAADITLGGITQTHVIADYETVYANYQEKYFKGRETNWPTDIVIPGLSSTDDYTPQGMTYWPAKEWILISAYDASGSNKHSVIYAIDIITGDFVALFKLLNIDGTPNTSHGGGIAASEYNFYYADTDAATDTGSRISYIPLSEMDVEKNTVKEVKIHGSIDCSGELFGGKVKNSSLNEVDTDKSAATSYCCYDEGVLWTGNFYFGDSASYTKYSYKANKDYNSMLLGYRLQGDSSLEEWHYLSYLTKQKIVPITLNKTEAQSVSRNNLNMTFTTTKNSDGSVNITGTITPTATGSFHTYERYGKLTLTGGRQYVLEYTSTNPNTGAYIFAPNGKHSTLSTTPVNNGNNTYTYRTVFTAGVKTLGDVSWGTTLPTDGSYTGEYTIRFDQNNVSTYREFTISNLTIKEAPTGFDGDSLKEGSNCAGNPSYCIAIEDGIDRIQYAMVDKGKIYISRSWDRNTGGTHVRALTIGDMDINVPGTVKMTVNGVERMGYKISSGGTTKEYNTDKMLYMGEALCIIEDYLYMFGEGAAYNYRAKDPDNTSLEPIDVIWKIDQHAIMDNPRSSTEDIEANHYEKVTDLSQLDGKSEYLVVYESPIKDRITQKNILYLLDSYGGYNGRKLPKVDNPTQGNTGDSMGSIGYKITSYTTDGNKLYIDDLDDARKSIRWTISSSNSQIKLANSDHYYAQNKYFVFNYSVMSMGTENTVEINSIYALPVGDGSFYLYSTYAQTGVKYPSYLWCNDGSDPDNTYISRYNEHYDNALSNKVYYGAEEIPGTFHVDALHQEPQYSGNKATDYTVGSDGVPNGFIYNDGGVYTGGRFSFYKRIPDPHAYTGDSQVYTDLKAEIQSDGTINLNLETYATASLHYKQLPEGTERPTDYIFVIDTSASMDGTASQAGFEYYGSSNTLSIGSVTGHSDGGPYDPGGTGLNTIDDNSDIHIRRSDGKLVPVYGAVYTKTYKKTMWWVSSIEQYFWAYYEEADGSYRVLRENSSTPYTLTKDQLYADINNGTGNYRSASTTSTGGADERCLERVYTGEHYAANRSISRPREISNSVSDFILEVAKNAKDTELNHRVAIVKCGSEPVSDSTGFFTAGTTTFNEHVSGYNTQTGYDNVFYEVEQFDKAISGVQSRTKAGGHSYIDYGMHMASEIIKASVAKGVDYTYNGNRSACIIVITDGGMTADENKTNKQSVSIGESAAHYAYAAKQAGASVYTWQYGSSNVPDFDSAKYMSYLSMEYVDTRLAMVNNVSTFLPGDRNPHPVEYNMVYGSGDGATAADMLDYVNENRKYSLARLDASSILKEKLDTKSFSFDKVENSDISIRTEDAYYDAIGRLAFKDNENTPSSIKADITNKNDGQITVTGFDYSKNYVSSTTIGLGTAKKLVITIKNVDFADDVVNMTDINRPIVDVPVSLADPTGIYMKNGEKHRSFPEDRVTIPQYTYVFDYGLGMLDVDINGTLVSVDTALQKQSTYSASKTQGNTSLTFTEDRQDMTYTINKDATDMQRYFVLIQRPNGEYDWFAINIVPATNVYFEQDIFAVSNKAQATWSSEGSVNFDRQSISLWDDVYGFDENYLADNSNYSQGAAIKTTVTSTNKRSDTMKTTFNGNGADIYSVCGPTTGIQVIAIRDTTQPKQSNGLYPIAKSYVVDTFYNDTNYPGPLYQVPIVRFEGDYKKYEVEITSAYLSIAGALQSQSVESAVIDENGTISYTSDFTNDKESVILEQLGFEELIGTDVEFVWYSEDSVLNGGSGAQGADEGAFTTQALNYIPLDSYIDGIRVYHPGGDNMDIYYKDSEKGAKYYNVFNNMRADSFSGSGISYIYGTQGGQELKFAEELESFFKGRPKNEVYLENSEKNAITFTVDNLDENSRVMVSLRTAQGSPKAVVNNSQFKDGTLSKMEMYYDITDYIGEIVDGKATVTIRNAGNGLLAVDNIKITGAGGIAAQSVLSDVFEIFSLDIVEVDPTKPINIQSSDKVEIPLPPVADEPEDNEPDDGNDDIVPPSDDNNPEEPAEDGFFAKVESFFVKIFNFFKNIFNKVSTFLKF